MGMRRGRGSLVYVDIQNGAAGQVHPSFPFLADAVFLSRERASEGSSAVRSSPDLSAYTLAYDLPLSMLSSAPAEPSCSWREPFPRRPPMPQVIHAPIPVRRQPGSLAFLPWLGAPLPPGSEWLPLRQAWTRPAASWPARAGWFRIRWLPQGLVIHSLFLSPRARNQATALNQRTWELGEVAETFIEERDASPYLEVHVTPENHRLQLRFPPGGIERLRAGSSTLDDFVINDEGWAQSAVRVEPGLWQSQLLLPAACFSPDFLQVGRVFKATFCRYDCADAGEPVLSATAPLAEPSYHRREDWQTFRLSDIDETLD